MCVCMCVCVCVCACVCAGASAGSFEGGSDDEGEGEEVFGVEGEDEGGWVCVGMVVGTREGGGGGIFVDVFGVES